MSGQEWRLEALCAETDPEVFFPAAGRSPKPALRICRLCDVREACLDDALALRDSDDYGIRGGMSERQRNRIRRARAHARRHLAPVVDLPVPAVPITAEEAA